MIINSLENGRFIHQSSVALEALILQVKLDELLAHHVQLRFVVLLYALSFRLSRFQLCLQICRELHFFFLHLVEFVFPLSVLFHDLKRATLAQLVDRLHFVRHLADFLQGFLLQKVKLLAIGALGHEFIDRYGFLRVRLLSLNVPLLEAGEHVAEEIEVLLGAFSGEDLRHVLFHRVEDTSTLCLLRALVLRLGCLRMIGTAGACHRLVRGAAHRRCSTCRLLHHLLMRRLRRRSYRRRNLRRAIRL